MPSFKKVPDVRVIDGVTVQVMSVNRANDDPIRAGRLARKARQGDKEAAKRLQEMQNTPMYEWAEDCPDNQNAPEQNTNNPATAETVPKEEER